MLGDDGLGDRAEPSFPVAHEQVEGVVGDRNHEVEVARLIGIATGERTAQPHRTNAVIGLTGRHETVEQRPIPR